jgi:hypothetical protein
MQAIIFRIVCTRSSVLPLMIVSDPCADDGLTDADRARRELRCVAEIGHVHVEAGPLAILILAKRVTISTSCPEQL